MQDYLSFSLPDDFIKGYSKKKVDWGFPAGGNVSLGELTFISKYSRRKEDGTKERWHETCRRVTEGFYSILKDFCKGNKTPWNEFKAQKAAQDAYDRMFNFKWLPPGRGLWAMGTRLVHEERNAAPLYNCFDSKTEIITDRGVEKLGHLVGSTVNVWADGWREATISVFGEQEVQDVTLKPFNLRTNRYETLTVTPNHRWILSDGTETTNLKVGDVVESNPVCEIEGSEYWDGILHGLIFGDGARDYVYENGDYKFKIEVCDDRTRHLIQESDHLVFDSLNQTNPDRPIYYKRSAVDLKEFPAEGSPAYMRGFVEGWGTADAYYVNGTMKITTQNIAAATWLHKWSAYAGYTVVGENLDSTLVTNYGPRKNPLCRISLTERRTKWKVIDIERSGDTRPVYCATVPSVGWFTLASGIKTGNCAFVSTEKLSHHSVAEATQPFVRLMEMSLNGIGVGFDTRGADRLILNQPSFDSVTHVVEDTREAWALSLQVLLESYLFKNRKTVIFDYSKIRPEGSPMLRSGGLAPGPGPLIDLHINIRFLLKDREGQKLTSLDIVDIMNMAGKAVVSGGIRRSAEIALGFHDDQSFLDAKDWNINPERMGADGWGHLSNNTIIANVGDSLDHVIDKITLNGEPGIFFIDLARQYGRLKDPKTDKDSAIMGLNPCAEILLEDNELCNIMETFPNRHESQEDYRRTLKCAYLYSKAVTLLPTPWEETNEVITRNRRIGASMSGIAEFVETRGWQPLREMCDDGYRYVQDLDKKYSMWLGIRESIKTTTVKPSGSVSILAGETPGVHWPVKSGRFIRRQRFNVTSPMIQGFIDAGYTVEPDVMDPKYTMVVEFPVDGHNIRDENHVTVWEKMALAALLQEFWSDNSVSATFSFREDERLEIGPAIKAFEGKLKTLSFLPPKETTHYEQMPYGECTDAEFEAMVKAIKPLDRSVLYGETAEDAVGEKFCNNDVCLL